jgi:hypothetical chaperone protein
MIIGMDFGTTNTGAAIFDGGRVRLLPLDPASPTPEICRSAIYMTRSGEFYLGSGAMSSYFAQNIGRPTRFRKVWVGEIQQVFAELPVFYRDVFVFEDEFSPGRLFTSIKTALRSQDYYGTAFRGSWFSASDLVGVFMIGMKMQMEGHLGGPVKEIVLGRPVHFSTKPDEDQIAQSRLLDAAFKAGFERVYLEYEPVAAALAYERGLSNREVILVFDFGGGTLDFTIMQVGGYGERRVLATGGVPIAGDIFDQRLFRVVIPRHLGEGQEYLSRSIRRPIPAHIFDTLAQPAEILSLNTPHNLEILQQIHAGSLDKEKTHALLKVVSANYALMMFDLVERTKRQLSDDYLSRLEVDTPDFAFHELVSRATFERAIRREVKMIRAELVETVQRAGIQPHEIDRVIRTGGSSQIPLFVSLLSEIFGAEKVQAIDIFSSVTSGLAIRGEQIERGQAELAVYTPDSQARSSEHTVDETGTGERREKQVAPIDLSEIRKRLEVRQEARLEPERLPKQLLFVLNPAGVFASEWDSSSILNLSPELNSVVQFSLAALEDNLLLVTNHFKLISAPVRDLYLAQLANAQGIAQTLPLDSDETVSALMTWRPNAPAQPLVVMVTAVGQGRAFDQALLADTIARRPYFQLERRYTGIPVRLLPAWPGAAIIVGTDQGRAARANISDMSVQPYEILRLRNDEWLLSAMVLQMEQPLAALDIHGNLFVFDPTKLPAGGSPAQRAQYLRRSFPVIGLFSMAELARGNLIAVSTQGRLYRLGFADGEAGTAEGFHRLIKLGAHETLAGCLIG